MNPIEFLFHSWKHKADMMLKGGELNERVIKKAVEVSFRETTPISIQSLVHHVVEKVYPNGVQWWHHLRVSLKHAASKAAHWKTAHFLKVLWMLAFCFHTLTFTKSMILSSFGLLSSSLERERFKTKPIAQK